MSSMVRFAFASVLLASVAVTALPARAQDATYGAADWDKARANLVAREPGRMAQAVSLWQQLTASKSYSFGDYANFLLAYPRFPDADKLQGFAEDRLRLETIPADRLVAFFDRYPPQSNFARGQYALAKATLRPAEALEIIRAAWRGGELDPGTEATLLSTYGRYFTQDDQDARMDALLWQRNSAAAARQIAYVSPARRASFQARLAILQGGDGSTTDPLASADPGYLYNRSRELRTEGRLRDAVDLLANHPHLSFRPFDQTAWVSELLTVARLDPGKDVRASRTQLADAATALRAGRIDAFFFSGGLPIPQIAELAKQMPIRLVELADYAAPLRKKYPAFYEEQSILASTYGLDAPVQTIGVPNYLVVNASMPDDRAYALTRLLFTRRDDLAAAHPAALYLDRRSAVSTYPLPLHPGAIRYYRETKGEG